ncbi:MULTISPECIES: GNAT family N-acetyltransferase [Staphylococcus]|jgi:putative acetyltransferase|uniref:GNAT family N-acetyltransferase n=1 Tax=Staphylococcus TaxID=1279 RepID=UPI0001EF4AD0|nr:MULTISPECIES: GNAT family N-acetyltransferase [Staphylococcus]EFS18169.1 acetyltransferase, GNAT family [Staphylococcus capitis C87]MBC3049970.1 GNAT family N-acetyltransferase [Staphylococcus capitis]MBC3069796.1 GNAT family N-acetyltransferase [Staphylococcus capitis]MBC3072131.1 GNAT family N-acetyltransferase [Staphylococcus capitis]MBC3083039.1 GNAT family N-acetyltransferase [Staphylococcus capitis]
MTLIRRKIGQKDYHKVLDIWEKSVISTHDFLKEKDRLELKTEIPNYLNYVEAYFWCDEDEIIGFSGTNDQNLEMLFIDPKYFRKGYGTKILQTLIHEDKVRYVEVNKDNNNAVKFYQKNGFKKHKEALKDEQGRDYPIYYLKI